jgi:rubrerythrin
MSHESDRWLAVMPSEKGGFELAGAAWYTVWFCRLCGHKWSEHKPPGRAPRGCPRKR